MGLPKQGVTDYLNEADVSVRHSRTEGVVFTQEGYQNGFGPWASVGIGLHEMPCYQPRVT